METRIDVASIRLVVVFVAVIGMWRGEPMATEWWKRLLVQVIDGMLGQEACTKAAITFTIMADGIICVNDQLKEPPHAPATADFFTAAGRRCITHGE